MKYKLYDKATNDTSNIIKEVLKNRGIDDYQSYLHLTDKVVIPWENLDNMFEAVNLFESHYSEKNVISILVDEDPDGFCSAAMMYLYIKEMDKTYPVEYIMHRRAKSHGLSDDVTIPSNTKLSNILQDECVCYYIKPELHQVGMIFRKTTLGNEVRCYNAERTICDLLRSRNRLNEETVISAIKNYAVSADKDLNLLAIYAPQFGVEKILKRYMEVLL